MPRLLTVEQKQQRIHDSKRCLELFTRNKKDFLRRYITINGTWIHHFTRRKERQLSGEDRAKAGQSARRHNSQQARSWPLYFGTCTEFCSSTFFRRARRSTATTTLPYWIDWKTQSRRKGLIWQRRNPCRKIRSGRWSAQARNDGSQGWLSILDRWSIEAWMIITGLYCLVILAPKSLPMIGRESLPELSRRSFKFIKILIMTIKFKT